MGQHRIVVNIGARPHHKTPCYKGYPSPDPFKNTLNHHKSLLEASYFTKNTICKTFKPRKKYSFGHIPLLEAISYMFYIF
jgi:hypothetical protein